MTPIFAIFGLGTTEIILICVVVLVLFGAKKIPEFARSLGKAKREFTEASSEFNNAMHEEANKPKQSAQKIAPPAGDDGLKADAPVRKEEKH
jgi:sec-independent protein translocase protein TatA